MTTQPTKYTGVLTDAETELGLLGLQIDSYDSYRNIMPYYIAASPDAQLHRRGLEAPVINITGIFDVDKEDRNDNERRLRRMLTTTADVYCINLSKGTALCFVPQRPSHAVNVPFWNTIDNFGLTGLQKGQTLGYAHLAAECTTDGTITTDYLYLEGIERNALRLKVADIGCSSGSKYVYFELDQTAHELPLGTYEFIMRARASAHSDTLTMAVSNEDVTEDWEEAYDSAAATAFLCLKKHGGKLYAGGNNGIIYVSNNGTNWNAEYDTVQSEVHCLEIHNNLLYAGTGNNGKIFKRNSAGAWAEDYDLPNAETDVYALHSAFGYLYAAGNSSHVYKYSAGAWALHKTLISGFCTTTYALTSDSSYLYLATAGNTYGASICEMYQGGTDTSLLSLNGHGTAMKAAKAINGILYAGDNAGWFYKVKWGSDEDATGQASVNGIFNFYGFPFIGTSSNGKLYLYTASGNLAEIKDFSVPDLYCGENFGAHNYVGTGNTGKIYRTTDKINTTKDVNCSSDHIYKWFALPFEIKERDKGCTIRFTVTNNHVPLGSSAHVYVDVMGIVSK